jgi:hypothetical protein
VHELEVREERVCHVLEENWLAVDEVEGHSLWAGVG